MHRSRAPVRQLTRSRSRSRSANRGAAAAAAALDVTDASAPTAATLSRTPQITSVVQKIPAHPTPTAIAAAMSLTRKPKTTRATVPARPVVASSPAPVPVGRNTAAAAAESLAAFAAASAHTNAMETASLLGAWAGSRGSTALPSGIPSGMATPIPETVGVDQPLSMAQLGEGQLVHAALLHHSPLRQAQESLSSIPMPSHAELGTSMPLPPVSPPRPPVPMTPATPVVPVGSARISDLQPQEKGKIGALLREVMTLKQARAKLEGQQAALQDRVLLLTQQSSLSEAEAKELREQCARGVEMIADYERRLTEAQQRQQEQTKSDAEEKKRSDTSMTSIGTSPIASAAVSRLHDLTERTRAAATTPAMVAAQGTQTSAKEPTRYLPSASAAALSPFIQESAHPATTPAYRSVTSSNYVTDEDQPRPSSRQPIASPVSNQVIDTRSTLRSTESDLNAAMKRIHKEYSAATDQLRSLSRSPTRRRLDLDDDGLSAVSSPRTGRRSHRSDLMHSPPGRSITLLRANTSPSRLPTLTVVPQAVSGITRAIALSSPENIERRAAILAQQMFDRKMAEQAEEARRKREAERLKSGPSRERSIERPSRTESRSSVAPPYRPPSSSSLSSLFKSHPLTSQLSPLHSERKQVPEQLQQSQRRVKDKDETKHVTYRESGSKVRESGSRSHSNGTEPAAPTQSSLAAAMLSKSVQLAQAFAEERRARIGSDELSANPNRFEQNSSLASSLNRSRGAPIIETSPSVPDSPFSHVLSSDEVAMLTPTSRKIHRLLAIQNPAAVAAQRAAEAEAAARDAELQAIKEREARYEAEAAARLKARRLDIAAAEALMARSGVDKATVSARANAVAAVPSQRSRTPAETYVPPPFSFRPSSRTSNGRTDTDAATVQNADLRSPQTLPAAPSSFTSPAFSSLGSTPGSAVQVPNGHTSFVSPGVSASERNTGGTGLAGLTPSDAEDEVLDLFHVRSPGSVQQRDVEPRTQSNSNSHIRQRPPLPSHPSTQRHTDHSNTFVHDMMSASNAAQAARAREYSVVPQIAVPLVRVNRPRSDSSTSPSGVESRVASMHLTQLERELDQLMPQVMHSLQQQQQRSGGEYSDTPSDIVVSTQPPQERTVRPQSLSEESRLAASRDRRQARQQRDAELRLRAEQRQPQSRGNGNGNSMASSLALSTPAHSTIGDFDASLLDVLDQMDGE